MPIYPTVLYIKQHSVTGLKYFGKTTRDPYKYQGSGVHWKRHIKKHGKEHVITIWVSEPYTDAVLISEFALSFSKDNNIIESKEWANLVYENGLDGGIHGLSCKPRSIETRKKLSEAGKNASVETRLKISETLKGRKQSDESNQKRSETMKGKPLSAEHIKNRVDARKRNRLAFLTNRGKYDPCV